MKAELLGLVSALSASGKTLMVETHDRWPRWRALPARVQLPSPRVPTCIGVRGERGFTAVELMVTIAIVGVLSAIAAPALMSMIQTQRVKSATFDLYAALTFARSEAIKRNAVVTITPRTGGFANGYDLFDANNVVLRSHLGSPAVSITATNAALAFDGYGRLTSASYQLQLTSSQSSSIPKRCLLISPTGRPSIRVCLGHR